ncbi:hypothetical protein Tco_1444603 [Tanacetum coccineum]
MPPCPYPTTGWSRPTGPSAGILGPRPSQAYTASVAPSTLAYALELEIAMHTMTLNPPNENWYMDTGASSHMTGLQGIQLMRCDSSENLYPLTTTALQQLQPPSTFAAKIYAIDV